MSRETINTYPQDNFDHAGHIADFLQTSAVYLGVNTDLVKSLSQRAWMPKPAIRSQEAPYA